MNIAILGGRFDPPHWGHFWIARQVLEKGPGISEVWLLPVHTHAWKPAIAEPADRLHMVKLLETDKIKVSEIEIERAGISYTIETIKYLKENFPRDKFYWIVGSDALADFFRWRQSAKLAQQIPFLVFPRSGYPIKILPFGMQKINEAEIIQTNLSSTHVRERLRNKLSIYGLVPSPVEYYINQKKLYMQ